MKIKSIFIPFFLLLDGSIWYYQNIKGQIVVPDFLPLPVVSSTLMELVTNEMLVFFSLLLFVTIIIRINLFFSRIPLLKRTVIALVLVGIYFVYEGVLWLLDISVVFTIPIVRLQVTLPLIVPDIITVLDVNLLWFIFIIFVYSIFFGLSILVPLNPGNLTFRIIYILLRVVIPLKFTEISMNTDLKLPKEPGPDKT